MSRTLTLAPWVLAIAALAGCGEPTATPDATETPQVGDVGSYRSEASNTLKWEASAERGVYGYLIYRADDRAGPFRRINSHVVRVPQDTDESHRYTYVDETVEPGRTYHYYLDAVAKTGTKQRFSGIVTKTASVDS